MSYLKAIGRRFALWCLAGALILAPPGLASARYVVGFYSHSWGVGEGMLYFPHAFILVRGAPDNGGAPIEQSFGFTDPAPTPALLFHRSRGEVIDSRKDYLAVSRKHFSIDITDDQYRNLIQAVRAWESVKGDPYDLHTRNCITFVGEMARALGLNVGDERITDPSRFLEDLRSLNPSIVAKEDSATARAPGGIGTVTEPSSEPVARAP